jgi:hypothetical protein
VVNATRKGFRPLQNAAQRIGARGLILLLDIDCWPISAAEIGIASGQCQFRKGFRLTLQNAAQSRMEPVVDFATY